MSVLLEDESFVDNLTHSLMGAAIGVTVAGVARREGREIGRGAIVGCAIAASNLPDIDLVLPPHAGELTYMLYHRGYTHTLVGGAALALLAAGAFRLVPWRRPPPWGRLMAAALLGALFHLFMDFTNDYGLHPFSPFWNEWIYGDFIFIFEPLIIVALLPLAFEPLRWIGRNLAPGAARWVRGIPAAAIVILILAIWACAAARFWMTAPAAALITVWAGLQWCLQRRRQSIVFAWLSVATVWIGFGACSRWVKYEARHLLADRASGERVVQLATTPAPGNPFCWRIVSTSRRDATGELDVRLGTVSLVPALVSPAACYIPNRVPPPNAVLSPSDLRDDGSWHWVGRFVAPESEFAELAERSCRVAASRRFFRAPFWTRRGSDDSIVLGDLRLDYQPDLQHFCKFRYSPGGQEECPPAVPWTPPFFGR